MAGRDVARAAVKQALQAYLRTVPYTTQLRVPPRHMGVIKAMLDGAQYPKVTYCTPTPALLKLESCDYDMLMEEVRPAITERLAELAVEYATCYICMEETAVRLCTCGHRLCDDCGVQHVATEAANNAIPVVCKALCGCNLSLLQEDLARLTSNVDDVYAAGLRSFMLQDAARARYTYCHTPDCPEILNKLESSVVCPTCMRLQCPLCGEEPHAPLTCEESLAQSEKAVAYHVNKITSSMLAPQCPRCTATFIDFSNCFALTCSCGTGLCGWCLHDCGEEDPHQHVGRCDVRKAPFASYDMFFPSPPEAAFRAAMQRALTAALQEYLGGLPPAVRADVCKRIQPTVDSSEFVSFPNIR